MLELGPKLRARGVPVGRTGLAGPGLGESPAELSGILRAEERKSNTWTARGIHMFGSLQLIVLSCLPNWKIRNFTPRPGCWLWLAMAGYGWLGGYLGMFCKSGRSTRIFPILSHQHREQLPRKIRDFSPDFEGSGYAAIFNVALWSVWCGMAGRSSSSSS